jgi:hypothetical protein
MRILIKKGVAKNARNHLLGFKTWRKHHTMKLLQNLLAFSMLLIVLPDYYLCYLYCP